MTDTDNFATGNRFKQLYKYIAKAKQIEAIEPVVAYSCKLYAAQLAMKWSNRTSEENNLLSELIDILESTNSVIRDISKDDIKLRCENFALSIFDSADNSDRSDNGPDRQTAIQFHTAYILMDICKQFGELDTDIQTKLKYSMYKATEITKALKEGRKPQKGGFDEYNTTDNVNDDTQHNDSTTTTQQQPSTTRQSSIQSQSSITSASASAPSPPVSNLNQRQTSLPPPATNPNFNNNTTTNQTNTTSSTRTTSTQQSQIKPSASFVSSSSSSSLSSFSIPSDRVNAQKEAERQIKHALSAIAFDDIDTTVIKLQNALHCLEPYVQNRRAI